MVIDASATSRRSARPNKESPEDYSEAGLIDLNQDKNRTRIIMQYGISAKEAEAALHTLAVRLLEGYK